MSQALVKAGQCRQETSIEAHRSDMTHVALAFRRGYFAGRKRLRNKS